MTSRLPGPERSVCGRLAPRRRNDTGFVRLVGGRRVASSVRIRRPAARRERRKKASTGTAPCRSFPAVRAAFFRYFRMAAARPWHVLRPHRLASFVPRILRVIAATSLSMKPPASGRRNSMEGGAWSRRGRTTAVRAVKIAEAAWQKPGTEHFRLGRQHCLW